MSLKGGIKHPVQWANEVGAILEDLENGKEGAAKRLHKYVEDGTMSTKRYEQLIELYGTVPSEENTKTEKTKTEKAKKEKTTWYFYGIPLTWATFFKALYIFAILVSICILIYNINKWAWYSICFLCFCAWAYHKSKLDDSKNLYRKVAWISDRNFGELGKLNLRNFELSEYIEFEQRKQNIPEEFQIDFSNETEKGNLAKILDSHKEHVIKSYFSERLAESKNIYNLDNQEYYFFSLNRFVCENLSCYHVGEVYENKVTVSEYKFKYNLTDFGRTYYKLWLLTEYYVESNECVKKFYTNWKSSRKDCIMERLQKNEVTFLSYRP